MKRVFPVVLACLALTVALSLTAFASDPGEVTDEVSYESKPVCVTLGTEERTGADGVVYTVSGTSIEYHPVGFGMASGGCRKGSHTAKTYTAPADAAVWHRNAEHPVYCSIEYRRDWQCSDCGSYGTDVKAALVWCSGSDTADDPFSGIELFD